jgi:hypothetical protein
MTEAIIPFGGMSRESLKDDDAKSLGRSGWTYARPIPFYSWPCRIRMAWHVLTYRADALYWTSDERVRYDQRSGGRCDPRLEADDD